MGTMKFTDNARGPGARLREVAIAIAVVQLLIFQVSCTSPVNAGTQARINEAAALMQKGDYAPAYCIWTELADDGVPEAQYTLGWMYYNGYGVAVDDERARDWWEAAADEDHIEAQFSLAMLLSQGRSGNRDIEQAVKWYNMAAQNGHEEAGLILAAFARQGNATARRFVKQLARKGRIGRNVRIIVDRANVREEPSTQSKKLATLKKGTRLVDIGLSGKWHKVWIPGLSKIAWIHEGLIE